jgi:hypothetical protein
VKPKDVPATAPCLNSYSSSDDDVVEIQGPITCTSSKRRSHKLKEQLQEQFLHPSKRVKMNSTGVLTPSTVFEGCNDDQ